jgi:hypothetical protein
MPNFSRLRVWVARLGLFAIIALVILIAYIALIILGEKPGKSISGKSDNFLFDPFALETQPLRRSILTPAPLSEGSKPIPGAKNVLVNDITLYELADELAHQYEPSALLSFVFLDGLCQRYQEGVYRAYFAYQAFNVGTDELYPHEESWVFISIENGSVFYSSDYYRDLDETHLEYPPAVPYRQAMQIARANGGAEAERQSGPACEFEAMLEKDEWAIYWYKGRAKASGVILEQRINASTGEVRKIEWRDREK